MIECATLSFRSTARQPFGLGDWHMLADLCRARNAQAGISGALLFDGTYFFQVMEGPVEALSALFARIRADQRHGDVIPFGVARLPAPRFEGFRTRWVTGQDAGRMRLDELGYHRMSQPEDLSDYMSTAISAGLGAEPAIANQA